MNRIFTFPTVHTAFKVMRHPVSTLFFKFSNGLKGLDVLAIVSTKGCLQIIYSQSYPSENAQLEPVFKTGHYISGLNCTLQKYVYLRKNIKTYKV